MEIYCGLCGQQSHELFGHLREVHEMGPDRYGERLKEALRVWRGRYRAAKRAMARALDQTPDT